jgi:hypothetical protein
METLTVAGPDTPGEVELVLPPPPHATSAAEIIRATIRYMTFRTDPTDVLMALSSNNNVFPLPFRCSSFRRSATLQ